MGKYGIRDINQANAIIYAYEHCSICSNCILNNPEGWRCSYLYDHAKRYARYAKKHMPA